MSEAGTESARGRAAGGGEAVRKGAGAGCGGSIMPDYSPKCK